MSRDIPLMNERAQIAEDAVERYIAEDNLSAHAHYLILRLDLSPASIRNVMADLKFRLHREPAHLRRAYPHFARYRFSSTLTHHQAARSFEINKLEGHCTRRTPASCDWPLKYWPYHALAGVVVTPDVAPGSAHRVREASESAFCSYWSP